MNLDKIIKIRQEISPTMCLAKFHEASIWVYSGKIASCHYTPFIQVGNTVDTFYNPPEKRQQQKEMIAGDQPEACNSCWNFENLGLKSDRTRKSMSFNDHLSYENYKDPSYVFKPKALELAFQNTCNLACSYCSPQFSTSWLNDIRVNGVYTDITTDDRRHYQKDLKEIDLMIEPPDLTLFWEWFDSIADSLESIRVSGGEPLMHEEVFRLFSTMTERNPNIECVIHTNLCQKPTIIGRFLNNIKKLPNVRVNVSNESAGEVAEFIRDGMVYSEWLTNLEKLCNSTARLVTVSTTCSAIAMQTLDELFLDIIELRKRTLVRPYISINMVDKPRFQSLDVLTRDERLFYLNKFRKFYDEHKQQFLKEEHEHFNRLITFLNENLVPENQESLRKDSDIFFAQYSQRRKKAINFAQQIGLK
jgi:MoaA/NifB/PqqE/SkfB family radical SAM enzyme